MITCFASRTRPCSTLLLIAILVGGTIALAAGLALLSVWITAPHPRFSAADAAMLEADADSGHGREVFAAADCASCHASPGQPDRRRLGGRLALASPFGAFHVPNISMDPVDGIGRWSTVDIANAVMSGIAPDGSHYYPVFPYTSFARMSVADVRDLIAYLRTLPAVPGRARPPDIPFPLSIRRLVGAWKTLYFHSAPIEIAPDRSMAWNRGRYLAESATHCAECHSSRNLFGAIRPDTRFAGGVDPEGTGFVPNITPAAIGHWTRDDIAAALLTGHTPEGRTIGSSMAEVVTNMADLLPGDRQAIAEYVASLPARPTPSP